MVGRYARGWWWCVLDSAASRRISDMAVDHADAGAVASVLQAAGLEQYGSSFESQGITVDHLTGLRLSEYPDLGVRGSEDCRRLYLLVRDLQKKRRANPPPKSHKPRVAGPEGQLGGEGGGSGGGADDGWQQQQQEQQLLHAGRQRPGTKRSGASSSSSMGILTGEDDRDAVIRPRTADPRDQWAYHRLHVGRAAAPPVGGSTTCSGPVTARVSRAGVMMRRRAAELRARVGSGASGGSGSSGGGGGTSGTSAVGTMVPAASEALSGAAAAAATTVAVTGPVPPATAHSNTGSGMACGGGR